jgi:hypothetical protein
MPQFHFDVSENGVITPDEDGMDLLNAKLARLEAARAAAEMLRHRTLQNAEPADVFIIVRDGNPEPLCVVTVRLKLAGNC